MKQQILQLQKQNRDLKEVLFDLVLAMGKYTKEMGLTDQEIYSKAKSMTTGSAHNPADFDFTCKNGEQGR
ncbi:MAG TPA: hypothetical protein VD794_02135 [Flavisolibacter sp.]|nr:hypothetical protein [Flavisolibacter sp.]